MVRQQGTPRRPGEWKRFTETQEVWAWRIGGVITLLIFLTSFVLVLLTSLDVNDPLPFIRNVGGTVTLVAFLGAGLRVYAHQRSHWLDLFGKALGFWAAGLTLVVGIVQFVFGSL